MHKRTAHGEEEVILDTEGTLIFTGTEPGEHQDTLLSTFNLA